MAYDEGLAERLREALQGQADITERKMFGGMAFMVRGHMCVGILGDVLMARVGPGAYEQALALPHVRPMDFTGRPMRGYVFVDPPGIAEDADLAALGPTLP
ncbi:TfoX/Sxy family protein [Pseudomonas benzenivorans]|uniref:TfoX/Sxy family protein n=1 Tax=Pseudomonas benzenivorans TaxID=556533 RepID=UPI0035139F00